MRKNYLENYLNKKFSFLLFFCVFLHFSLVHGMEDVQEDFPQSIQKQLSKNYVCEQNEALTKDLNEWINDRKIEFSQNPSNMANQKLISSPCNTKFFKINQEIGQEDSTNFLKARLYVCKNKIWERYDSPITWTSGWQRPPTRGLDSKYNNNRYQTCLSVGDVYYGAEKNQRSMDSLRGNKLWDEKIEKSILDGFNSRGIPEPFKTENEFYNRYCHSEQAFISSLQEFSKNHAPTTEDVDNMLLVFYSTNPPCHTCSPTLINMMSSNHKRSQFRTLLLNFFIKAEQKSSSYIFSMEKHHKTLNILYAYNNNSRECVDSLPLNDANNLYTIAGAEIATSSAIAYNRTYSLNLNS